MQLLQAFALLPSRPAPIAPSCRGGVPIASEGGSLSVASDGSWLRGVLDQDEQDRFTLATLLHHSREVAEQDRTELTYGEFDLDGFHEALDYAVDGLPDLRRCTFCDLGSGAGRLVLAAAARYPWEKCVGIEALPDLHRMSGLLHAVAIDAAAEADGAALSPCEPCSMLKLGVLAAVQLAAHGSRRPRACARRPSGPRAKLRSLGPRGAALESLRGAAKRAA